MSSKNPLLHRLERMQKQKNSRSVLLPREIVFLDEIIAWANIHNISKDKLPRDRKTLLEQPYLDLTNNQLTELTESIGNLTNLNTLFFSVNHLNENSDTIGNCVNLKCLYLRDNKLTKIPEAISKLTNLKELNLSDNKLTEIPEFIGNLTNLKKLDLSFNNITKIPEFISKLQNLTELHLSYSQLTEVPDCVRNMPNLNIIGLDEKSHSTEKIKMTPQQKILFGSPGTGKSHKIDHDIIPYQLDIDSAVNPENVIKTVFHPEYTYGDFIGKLVPSTPRSGGTPQYLFYEGHFLKALAQAYKNIIAAHDNNENVKNVALVIDEINRGNSAAIFGTTFQLLDRNLDGWSSYAVNVNEITFTRLFELCDLQEVEVGRKLHAYKLGGKEISANDFQQYLKENLHCDFKNRTVKIPPNLSILASMNTSDSSIYYMDSAFKRRWQWEFIDIDGTSTSETGVAFQNRAEWIIFVGKLNTFIKSNHKYIRGIEDKQIGHYFITDEQIQKSTIQNKLMFFLWDSVFNRDKKPLITLLFGDNKDNPLITFGDFAKEVKLFINNVMEINS